MKLSAVLLLFLSLRCFADSPQWQIDLETYRSDGHLPGYNSFLSIWRVQFDTEKECEDFGEKALRGFTGKVMPDGVRTLPAFQCERMP